MPFTIGQRVYYIDGWDEETEVECTVVAVVKDEHGTSYEVECSNGAVTVIKEKDLHAQRN